MRILNNFEKIMKINKKETNKKIHNYKKLKIIIFKIIKISKFKECL